MFNDVEETHWSYPVIKKTAEAGLMAGFPDGSFKPGEPVTREQLAAVMAKILLINGTFERGSIPELLKSVCMVGRPDNALGSGFCFKNDGQFSYILTNAHVVKGFSSFTLIKEGGFPNTPADLVVMDENIDLGVIKAYADLPPLPITGEIYVGMPVLALGTPKGYCESATVGIISHLNREYGRFQTDCPISPGNSGGPLINEAGEVVGVINSKYVAVDTEGMAFGIKGADALYWLQYAAGLI